MMCNTCFLGGAVYTQGDVLRALEYWDVAQDDDLRLFEWVK